jgi:hypothetical protein
MTSATSLIRLQSDLKEHVKGEYEFRNTRNGTRFITKEMADYSAMISYLEKNNVQYFTFSNSEKPIKAVICHLPPDTPAEDISNSLEDLGFSVINVKQLTANQRATNGQTLLEILPLFLVTITRNITFYDIVKLNSLNHIATDLLIAFLGSGSVNMINTTCSNVRYVSVDECYCSLLSNSQRTNKVAG